MKTVGYRYEHRRIKYFEGHGDSFVTLGQNRELDLRGVRDQGVIHSDK